MVGDGASGEPAAPPAAPRANRSGRTTAAGLVLAITVVAALFVTLIPSYADPDPFGKGVTIPGSSVAVTGVVRDPAGNAMPGVRVALDDANDTHVTTDDNGSFAMLDVPAGAYRVTFNASDTGTLTVRVLVLRDVALDVTLDVPSGEQRVRDHASVADHVLARRTLAAALTATTFLTALGAYACFRRRWRPLALVACAASLPLLLPLTLVLSLTAFVMVLRAKADFR